MRKRCSGDASHWEGASELRLQGLLEGEIGKEAAAHPLNITTTQEDHHKVTHQRQIEPEVKLETRRLGGNDNIQWLFVCVFEYFLD